MASACNLAGMTIEPVAHKGAAFASSLAHDPARLTVTLLKLSDNRLDRLFYRAIPPSFPHTDPTAREVGQHGNYRIIFSSQAVGWETAPLLWCARDIFISNDWTANADAESVIEHARLNKL